MVGIAPYHITQMNSVIKTKKDLHKVGRIWSKIIRRAVLYQAYERRVFSKLCNFLALYAEYYQLDGSKFRNADQAYDFGKYVNRGQSRNGVTLDDCEKILSRATDALSRLEDRIELRGFQPISATIGITGPPSISGSLASSSTSSTLSKSKSDMSLLTPPEVARILRVSPEKVIAWIRNDKLKGSNLSQKGKRPRFRITRQAIDEFLKRRSAAEKQPPTRARPMKRTVRDDVIEFF